MCATGKPSHLPSPEHTQTQLHTKRPFKLISTQSLQEVTVYQSASHHSMSKTYIQAMRKTLGCYSRPSPEQLQTFADVILQRFRYSSIAPSALMARGQQNANCPSLFSERAAVSKMQTALASSLKPLPFLRYFTCLEHFLTALLWSCSLEDTPPTSDLKRTGCPPSAILPRISLLPFHNPAFNFVSSYYVIHCATLLQGSSRTLPGN